MAHVLHLWDVYLPTLFDKTHPYCLEKSQGNSWLVTARWVDNGAQLPANVTVMSKQSTTETATPTFFQRARSALQRKFFWRRFNLFCEERCAATSPDLIHIHFGTTGARLLPFLRRTSLPVIVSFYGMDASEVLKSPKMRRQYQELFERVQGILVLCEAVKQRFVSLGCDPEKIKIWNLPAGVEDYPYEPRKTDPLVPRFFIAARFVEKKGYPFLLEAYDRILVSGRRATLTMMGYGPLKPNLDSLQEKYRKAGDGDVVRLIDTELRPDFSTIFREELSRHDIFVLPSTTAANGDDEGGPALTLVCAQAAGLPVICTPFPGSELSVRNGESGLICETDNSRSLEEKMRYLMDHPELWNSLGKKGSELVRAEFSYHGQLDKLWNYYLAVVAKPKDFSLAT